MRKIKYVVCFLVILLLGASLIACGESGTKDADAEQAEVVSVPAIADSSLDDNNSESTDDGLPMGSTYVKPDLDVENLVALEPLTDPSAMRFVYIPASYFGISELYGHEAIWGFMDGDEPALAIIHVDDGDITYLNGKAMSHVNYLEPGDIVESTSVTIKPSNPAEVYMDSGIYVEAGHDVGIYPFLDLIGMEPKELIWGYSGIHEAR